MEKQLWTKDGKRFYTVTTFKAGSEAVGPVRVNKVTLAECPKVRA